MAKKNIVNFYGRLQQLAKRGWNQSRIARAIGRSQSTLSHFRRGTIPKLDLVVAIWRATGCNAHWLLTGEGEPFAPEQANPANPVIDNLDIVRRQVAALVEQAKSVAPECSTPCDSADKGIKMGTNMDPGAAESPVKNGSSSDQITV